MKTLRSYVVGGWHEATAGFTTLVNPSTEEPVARASSQGVDFAAECRAQGFDRTVCSCFVNGAEVATCEDSGGACGLAQRCCKPYFDPFR